MNARFPTGTVRECRGRLYVMTDEGWKFHRPTPAKRRVTDLAHDIRVAVTVRDLGAMERSLNELVSIALDALTDCDRS